MATVIGIEDGSPQAQYTTDSSGVITKKFSIVYLLLAAFTETEDDVINSVGIPGLYTTLRGATCTGYDADEECRVIVEGVVKILWKVKVSFDNSVDSEAGSGPNGSEDPRDWQPTVSWDGEMEARRLEKDAVTGLPIMTANSEEIIVDSDFPIQILEIERYETYPFDHTIPPRFVGKINGQQFYDQEVGTCLMLPIRAEEVSLKAGRFCKVRYRIKMDIRPVPGQPGVNFANTWRAELLHQGFLYRKTAVSEPEIFLDKTGNPRKVNLDDDGTRLLDTVALANATYIRANRFPYADFNLLSLGPF